jgi:hypothetical protein
MSSSHGTTENQVRRKEVVDIILKNGPLVVVVGTGVSIASLDESAEISKVAKWQGLLANGLARCEHQKKINGEDAKIVEMQIKGGTAEHLIDAAQKISDCLENDVNGKRYWLKETVGQLRVCRTGLIQAIEGLGGVLATLNYDDLLHQVTGRRTIHWLDDAEITRSIRNEPEKFILHLHGHWRTPESVVLDRKTYDAISSHEKTQDLLKEFARFRTLLFVGCGLTFNDPNFQTWLRWAKRAMAGEEHQHLILCLESEEQNFYQQLGEHAYLAPLVYGNKHEDLEPFLRGLARDGGAAAASVNFSDDATTTETIRSQPKISQPFDIWNREARK